MKRKVEPEQSEVGLQILGLLVNKEKISKLRVRKTNLCHKPILVSEEKDGAREDVDGSGDVAEGVVRVSQVVEVRRMEVQCH